MEFTKRGRCCDCPTPQLTSQPLIGIVVHDCGPAGGAELVVVVFTLVVEVALVAGSRSIPRGADKINNVGRPYVYVSR